jgi:DUF4097 and DUF4098 domain-containing protein YvlB
MKTSNKILLIAFAIMLASVVLILLKVKQYVYTNLDFSGHEKIELSGVVTDKKYDITNFNQLKVEGAISLELSKGESNSLTIKADTAIFKQIQVNQSDNRLTIKLINTHGKRHMATAVLHMPEMILEDLNVNAGAIVESDDTLKGSQMNVSTNAGAQTRISLTCQQLDCSANAGSITSLSGKAENVKASATAGAQIKAYKLLASKADANAVAGAQIHLNVTSELNANCTAGGSVRYKGSPVIKRVNTTAGGSISSDN